MWTWERVCDGCVVLLGGHVCNLYCVLETVVWYQLAIDFDAVDMTATKKEAKTGKEEETDCKGLQSSLKFNTYYYK